MIPSASKELNTYNVLSTLTGVFNNSLARLTQQKESLGRISLVNAIIPNFTPRIDAYMA